MRVGLDFDRTISAHPKLFRAIVDGLERNGDEWGIVTASSPTKRQHELDFLSKHGFPHPHFFVNKPDRIEEMPNTIWKKAQMAALGLHFLFDDLDTGRIRIFADEAGQEPGTPWN